MVVNTGLVSGAVLIGPTPDHTDVTETNVTEKTIIINATGYCNERREKTLVVNISQIISIFHSSV